MNTKIGSSKPATAEGAGNAQLDVDMVVLTMMGDTITSCVLDSVQAKVAFDAAGAITTDVTAAVKTKNELGENYGMVAWGGAIAEWDAQAAAFAAYVTGKTPAEVARYAASIGIKGIIQYNSFVHVDSRAVKYWAKKINGRETKVNGF